MKRALVVVDMQNDFITGALGFEGAKQVKENVLEKIQAYKAREDTVFYTMDTHDEGYLDSVEGKHLPVKHCIKGTWGQQIDADIAETIGDFDPVLEKPTFPSSGLLDYLRSGEYDTIELVGLVSHICVISNAVIAKAGAPNARIMVDARATDGPDQTLHNKALDVMENLHIEITNRS